MSDDPQFLRGDVDEGRYRPIELVDEGRSYQIVRAEELESGDEVCAKAILYETEREEEDAYVEQRRDALRADRERLDALELDWLPDVVDWFELEGEPVLVYASRPGTTLHRYVKSHSRRGLPPREAVELMRSLIEPLQRLHEAGYVLVDLDPRHVLVDDDGELAGLVGTANLSAIEERPSPSVMNYEEAPYVAPEARNERSGEMLRPLADLYGWGALLSFVLTEREPTSAVESPLQSDAYQALLEMDPEGAAVVVAATLQPMAKNRSESFEALAAALEGDGWLDGSTLEATTGDLPEPWSGAEPPGDPGGRALQSSLSPGPLISVPRSERAADDDTTSLTAAGGDPVSPSGEADEPDEPDDIEGVASEPVQEFLSRDDGSATPSAESDEETTGFGAGPGSETDAGDLQSGGPALEGLGEAADEISVDPEDVDEEMELGEQGDGDDPDRDDREISMLDENLDTSEETPPETSDEEEFESSLPPLSELPLKVRLLVGLVLPMGMMVVVFLLAFFRVI